MNEKSPNIGIDILVIKENKILLGLLTKKWSVNGSQVYGVPGTDIQYNERIGGAVKRNIKDELNCEVKDHKVFSVNANYEGGHYISIGVLVEIEGEIKILKPNDWEKWEWFDLYKIPEKLFISARLAIDSYLLKKVCVSE